MRESTAPSSCTPTRRGWRQGSGNPEWSSRLEQLPDYEVLHLLDPDRLANQSPCRERLRRILQGGYTQSLGIINGLLL